MSKAKFLSILFLLTTANVVAQSEKFEYRFSVDVETKVEWGHGKFGQEGEKGLNYLTTSHEASSEKGMGKLIIGQLQFGYTAREFNHSHPGETEYPSGSFDYTDNNGVFHPTGTYGDVKFASQVSSIFGKNVNFHIYISPNNAGGKGEQYIHFSPNSVRSHYGRMYHGNFAENLIITNLIFNNITSEWVGFYLNEYRIKDTSF